MLYGLDMPNAIRSSSVFYHTDTLAAMFPASFACFELIVISLKPSGNILVARVIDYHICYMPMQLNAIYINFIITFHFDPTVLYCTLLYSTVLYSVLFYSTLLYSTLATTLPYYSTLLYSK